MLMIFGLKNGKQRTKQKEKSEKDAKAPNIFERAKEEIEAVFHSQKSPRHTEETHGTSNDIDKDTPIDEVKGPNVFERVKEEVEALVEAIHPKKESKGHDSSSK
ncbi:hypothetical protein EZV62_003457 [Acer yangbiense]|uniref:Uncharacterized protein n=1 Tax=Acer yangbiense TaxID=1000413 RepID=A0A5C7IIM9_9ROSI|nr:hypothetical protein EZV62_003457 [Acer yangbiense]